jgi:hypothetical protein
MRVASGEVVPPEASPPGTGRQRAELVRTARADRALPGRARRRLALAPLSRLPHGDGSSLHAFRLDLRPGSRSSGGEPGSTASGPELGFSGHSHFTAAMRRRLQANSVGASRGAFTQVGWDGWDRWWRRHYRMLPALTCGRYRKPLIDHPTIDLSDLSGLSVPMHQLHRPAPRWPLPARSRFMMRRMTLPACF